MIANSMMPQNFGPMNPGRFPPMQPPMSPMPVQGGPGQQPMPQGFDPTGRTPMPPGPIFGGGGGPMPPQGPGVGQVQMPMQAQMPAMQPQQNYYAQMMQNRPMMRTL